MKFEEMLRCINKFCKAAGISDELACTIYRQKLSEYLKEDNCTTITVEQLRMLEFNCPGFKKSLEGKTYSSEILKKKLLYKRDELEDKWFELNDMYSKIVRENEMEIGAGLLYGITTLPATGDQKYDCFRRFLVGQICKHETADAKIKYYIPKWALDFFDMFFPEYIEVLKREEIPSAKKYKEYLQEREELEIQISNIEKQLGEITDNGRLVSFELEGNTIEIKYN